jgi:hypothetical protein
MNPNTQALIERLTPIAKTHLAHADGADADILRFSAENNGIIIRTTPPSVISTVLTGALRAAGGKPTDVTRRSMAPTARGRRVLVWKLA